MKTLLKVMAPAALLATLGACASPFQARVSRFQRLPAPQGQTFTIRSDDPRVTDSLEFSNYARLVSDRLAQQGYQPASSAGSANLVVTMNYGVDRGREKIRSTGFGPSGGFGPYGYGGFGYGRFGGFGRYGGFGPYGGFGHPGFAYGFYDPFLFDNYNDVYSYTVYSSELDLRIERPGSRERVFEGRAQAMSTDDNLTRLVPNLIEAMFTDFPGNNGETVKITIAPPSRRGA